MPLFSQLPIRHDAPPGSSWGVFGDDDEIGTLNFIHPDLMEGAKVAVRNMIAWIVEEHSLTRDDAYLLCSLAGDLKIHEIVDAGVWNVGMMLPLEVFVDGAEAGENAASP